jgi:hypothetical protein
VIDWLRVDVRQLLHAYYSKYSNAHNGKNLLIQWK